MKDKWKLFIAVALLLCVCAGSLACGKNDSENETDSSASVNDEVQLSDLIEEGNGEDKTTETSKKGKFEVEGTLSSDGWGPLVTGTPVFN